MTLIDAASISKSKGIIKVWVKKQNRSFTLSVFKNHPEFSQKTIDLYSAGYIPLAYLYDVATFKKRNPDPAEKEFVNMGILCELVAGIDSGESNMDYLAFNIRTNEWALLCQMKNHKMNNFPQEWHPLVPDSLINGIAKMIQKPVPVKPK